MGLFDGPAIKFAEKFAEYLDNRVGELYAIAEKAQTENDQWTRMVAIIKAESLAEISVALKTIAEL